MAIHTHSYHVWASFSHIRFLSRELMLGALRGPDNSKKERKEAKSWVNEEGKKDENEKLMSLKSNKDENKINGPYTEWRQIITSHPLTTQWRHASYTEAISRVFVNHLTTTMTIRCGFFSLKFDIFMLEFLILFVQIKRILPPPTHSFCAASKFDLLQMWPTESEKRRRKRHKINTRERSKNVNIETSHLN